MRSSKIFSYYFWPCIQLKQQEISGNAHEARDISYAGCQVI